MKILIGIGHPKQVHIWKNIVKNLVEHGHEVKILTSDKDVTLKLLNAYGFDYDIYGKYQKEMIKKAYGMVTNTLKVLAVAKKFNPDILIGGTPYLAYVSKMLGKPHIMFIDTEHANLANWLSYPFTDAICTPSCYKGKINPKKHVAFNGFFELAYLHPNYFTPNPEVLDELELSEDDKFIILRFVAWKASHDIRERGFTDKLRVVKILEEYGRVFITSENKIPQQLEKYRLSIPPEKIHHLMYYADMFIGESAPMSTESAILGTPAIFVSTSRRGYTDELESKYGMLYTFSDPRNAQEKAIDKAIELLEDGKTKREWQKKREKLLNDKIDVTKFMTELIEGYIENRSKFGMK